MIRNCLKGFWDGIAVLRESWDIKRKVERIGVSSLSDITTGDIMMTLVQSLSFLICNYKFRRDAEML